MVRRAHSAPPKTRPQTPTTCAALIGRVRHRRGRVRASRRSQAHPVIGGPSPPLTNVRRCTCWSSARIHPDGSRADERRSGPVNDCQRHRRWRSNSGPSRSKPATRVSVVEDFRIAGSPSVKTYYDSTIVQIVIPITPSPDSDFAWLVAHWTQTNYPDYPRVEGFKMSVEAGHLVVRCESSNFERVLKWLAKPGRGERKSALSQLNSEHQARLHSRQRREEAASNLVQDWYIRLTERSPNLALPPAMAFPEGTPPPP
jgi:hypothetical protein